MSPQLPRIDGEQRIHPIPLSNRRGLLYPAFVWSGLTSAFACVFIGNCLQTQLGTTEALAAVILGNWLLFIYSAAIGFAAGRWGLNSQLMLEAVFGRLGAMLPGVLLSLLVTGWFAFQVAFFTEVLSKVLKTASGPSTWILVVVGSLSATPVIVGINHGFNITRAAFPTMLLFAGIVLAEKIIPEWQTLLDGPLMGSLSFGAGVCVAFGTYAVSGTMTGDIVRYCRTGNEAVQATAIGFLFSNLPFMLLGVLIGAAHADVIGLLLAGDFLSTCMIALVVVSHLATCDACLTNASITLKSVFPKLPWSIVSASAAGVGIIGAADNLTTDVFRWAPFLAAIVPPIGGIIIADYYVLRAHLGFSRARNLRFNGAALASLCFAVVASLYLWDLYPQIPTPLVGAPLAGVLYLILAKMAPTVLGAGVGAESLGAEAID